MDLFSECCERLNHRGRGATAQVLGRSFLSTQDFAVQLLSALFRLASNRTHKMPNRHRRAPNGNGAHEMASLRARTGTGRRRIGAESPTRPAPSKPITPTTTGAISCPQQPPPRTMSTKGRKTASTLARLLKLGLWVDRFDTQFRT